MNKLTKNAIKWIVSLLVIVALGYAGSSDYQESVISSMSQELYQKIRSDLGGSPSNREICAKYQQEKESYDSLGI